MNTIDTNASDLYLRTYGVKDMHAWYDLMWELYHLNTADDHKTLVTNMLTDAKENISNGHYVDANYMINRATWLVNNKL